MLSAGAVSPVALVDSNRSAGRTPAADAGDTLLGFAGGEPMDGWTFATIVESLGDGSRRCLVPDPGPPPPD